jgi:diguanylate cyclase (GGDEF)-like protein
VQQPIIIEDDLLEESGRLQTLTEIGRVLASTLEMRTLYDTIYDQIVRVMDGTLFFISLYRPGRKVIDVPYLREAETLLLDVEVPYGNTVTSLVIDRGEPLRFNTLAEYRRFGLKHGLTVVSVGEHDPEAMVFVPLNTGSRTIGALSTQSLRPFAYTDNDVDILSVIASQAAVAIENARLYEETQSSVRHAEALLNVARVINSSLELEKVLDSILAGMREVMPYFLAAILLPDHSEAVLDIVGSIGPLTEERRRAMRIPFGVGVTGTVFVSGEPLNVPDVTKYDNFFQHGILEVQSEMAVPLKRGDTMIGVLDVGRERTDGFSPEDMDLMMLFASQASIAIENARLYSEQQNRVFELQAIQNVVQKLTPLHEVGAIAGVIDAELKGLFDYDDCRLLLLDEENTLVPISYSGIDLGDLRLKMGEGISGWIAEHGASASISNSLEDPRTRQIPGTPALAESLIGTPLIYQGRARGVVTLSKAGTSQFDENALRLLEIVAAQVAIALDRAAIYEQLKNEAITDPVTKLCNRRYLIERFREEKSRALRASHTLTAIMIDIDQFKTVNDTYGHDAGDVVLQELASLVRSIVRVEDLVARYGGEEFCVLLPEISLSGAEGVAERLRSAVESLTLPEAAGTRRLTVSVGVAVLSSEDEGTETFSRADHAMYHVKHLGGNRVCVDPGAPQGQYCLDN